MRPAAHLSQAEGRALLAREQGRRGRKYHNTPTMIGAERFDSKAEAADFGELLIRERLGEIRNLRRQSKHVLYCNGRKVGIYRDDFGYEERIGDAWVRVVHDTKGVRTALFNLKWAMMQAQHPDWRFVLS